MKRELLTNGKSNDKDSKRAKFINHEGENTNMGFMKLGEDLLFEVLKHVDVRTLAKAACVNRQWKNTAYDERLWEMLCTKQWANIACGTEQLRSVVLALGGFRRLHTLCLWPILKSSSKSSSNQCMPSPGKDEVHFSLSIMSVQYYEKMNLKLRQCRKF